MIFADAVGLFAGAVLLGAVHGIEPGHGWPVAATYALDQTNTWVYGFAASLLIGVGHLVSSIAMVLVFFYAKSYFDLAQVNEPLTVTGGYQIGGPVSLVAGILLIVLGIREYTHGHSHGAHGNGGGNVDHDTSHSHSHQVHDHSHSHVDDDHHVHSHDSGSPSGHDDHMHPGDEHANDSASGRLVDAIRRLLPIGGEDSTHASMEEGSVDRGLLGIAWFAFLLGFAHEEEFEIIALCAGSPYCLELMSAYAVTVILAIVAFTMLLIAGYEHYTDQVEQYTPYLPAFSAAVLSIMGVGFIFGVF